MAAIQLYFLFFLFSIVHHAVAATDCPVFACPDTNISIRFPFGVESLQSQSCGFPGFNLSCSDGSTVLHLPYSGRFLVRDINYLTQQIKLYDPDGCLPGRFLRSFNLSASPFVAEFRQNFTFMSCPAEVTMSRLAPITCLSNDTISVLATSSTSLARSMPESCKIISTLQVPVSWPGEYEEEFTTQLNDDLALTWFEPYCGDCEAQGGTCGLLNNTTAPQIGCFFNPATGETRGIHVFRIIALSIAVPAILLVSAIACFACFTDRRGRRIRMSTMRRNSDATAVLPTAEAENVVMGLDESTIESYTKLVLGESRRLPPGPNDTTCPICLSDYCTKETLRCIPHCKHCFHADCIDEWLRMNTTCPVCRKSPSQ